MLRNSFSSLMPNVSNVLASIPTSIGLGSGMNPPTEGEAPVEVTADHMQRWNKLIDFAKAKGYAGKEELNHNPVLRQKVFDEFNKTNPNDAIPISMVKPIQIEMQKYRQSVLDNYKIGKAAFPEGVTPENFMKDLSKEDNIFGSRTSSWKFPQGYFKGKQVEGLGKDAKKLVERGVGL